MIQIYDDDTLEAAVAAPLDDTVRGLINRIVSDAHSSDLWQLTCIVVIEDNDTVDDFEAILGFLPSTGPLGGEGAAAVPYWSWREDHRDTVELLVPAGDEGFCWFLIMSRAWFDTRIGMSDSR